VKEGSNSLHCAHQGKGDAILFIHGMPTNRMLWDGVIRQLSSHHRCFAVDLPGMGETPSIPYGPDYLDDLAERIESLRIEHGVEKWHVVGHDAGSAVAVQYAGRFSSRVGCLALLSPAIFPDLKPFYLLSPLRKPLIGEALAPLLHFIFWKIVMRRAIGRGSRSSLLRSFYEPFSGLAGAWRLMRLVRWGKPEDMLGALPAMLASLPTPTLLLHGLRDVLPAAFAERAASIIPNSTMITLDSGHFIPLEKPDEISACLDTFFEKNRTTASPTVHALKSRKLSPLPRTLAAHPIIVDGLAATASVQA
jgi:pimeloyl-ACP methyl ester carboxylesterase